MPIDLAGRTPYAYTRTSVNSKARRTKNEMERILYLEGDPSTVRQGGCAIRVHASARWGPSLEYLNSCYLSPTPRRQPNGGFGSAISSRTNNAVPFQSPPTATKHNENIYASADSLLVLLWGAAEMNGKRIDMEDKILVKYDAYGEDWVHPTSATAQLFTAKIDATLKSSISMGLFGVFDRHSDVGFSYDYIATNLSIKLQSQPGWALAYYGCNWEAGRTLPTSVFKQACLDLDDDLRKVTVKLKNDGGSTAIMTLICSHYMTMAYVGDSRCILVRKVAKKVEDDVAACGISNPRC